MRKPRKNLVAKPKSYRCHNFNIMRLGSWCLLAMTYLGASLSFAGSPANVNGLLLDETPPNLSQSVSQEAPTKQSLTATPLTAEGLRTQISSYLEQQIAQEPLPPGQTLTYTIEQLDFRIALNDCQVPLAITPYHQRHKRFAGRMTLKVSCQGAKPWRLFVPIRFTRMDRVVVTTQPITRRTILSSSMLRYKEQDVSSLSSGYYRAIQTISGYESKHFIQQGQILSPHHVIPPRMIERQQEVTIVSQSSRVAVKATGIALSDGRIGDRIKVRNKKSQRIIEVEVGGAGLVYARP